MTPTSGEERRVERAREEIASALDRAAPRMTEAEAVRMAVGALPGGAVRPGLRWMALPAAAAALALWIWVGPEAARPRGEPAPAFTASMGEERQAFAVRGTGEKRFAVFQTTNPKIRVVWLY